MGSPRSPAGRMEGGTRRSHSHLSGRHLGSGGGRRAATASWPPVAQTLRRVRDSRDGSPWTYFLLLWLAGSSLRFTLLAIPPLLPTIHRDLHLDEKTVGVLTALPVLLLATGAVFGSLLVARLGARR